MSRGLKLGHYTTSLIELNGYLVLFPGAKLTENGMTDFNENLLNSMPYSESDKVYEQGFYYEPIT